MPSNNQLLMRMSLMLSVSIFPKKPSTHGQRKLPLGSVTGVSPIPISTRLLVCPVGCFLSPLFNSKPTGPSEAEIRQHLTLEEEMEEIASNKIDSTDSFTETKYLLYGLDLEERQYVFPVLAPYFWS